MKKLLALGLSVTMAVSLAACGGNPEKETGGLLTVRITVHRNRRIRRRLPKAEHRIIVLRQARAPRLHCGHIRLETGVILRQWTAS